MTDDPGAGAGRAPPGPTARICVTPCGEDWLVRGAPHFDDVVLSRGGEAERLARRYARRLADAGHRVELRIYLRDGSLAGRPVTVRGDGGTSAPYPPHSMGGEPPRED